MGTHGEPVRIDESTTVIPVERRTLRGRTVTIGFLTVHDGETTWTPAVDGNLIAILGVSTGLIAATLSTLAILRRPPWPSDYTVALDERR
ncbi:MAG: hypothetical protein QM809_07395 [Gordonia sp. (in: high G+C Gram-positive bacteria)]|uniref:hypothetical protein n=1 Tax=Gordonia sp. (in: high G+C Gram-positive bacteria) TaxID=84139 RepID=UPI0039E21A79